MPISPIAQPGASARQPTAPTSVSASATSGGNATVSFTASTNPGKGSGNYVATSNPGSITGSASSSPISITGLTNGTAYTFTVVKQSGTGISSASSAASGSITAYSAPIFGTQSGVSTPLAPNTTTSLNVNNISTTTATLSYGLGQGASFYDFYNNNTGATQSSNSISTTAGGSNSWKIRVTGTTSFQLTTRVTPNGSSSSVSVEYGYLYAGSVVYSGNGTSGGQTSVSIGSSTSEQTTAWLLGGQDWLTNPMLGSDDKLYWRITVTYSGGSVQQTGSISAVRNVYDGSTVTWTSYNTYTYTSNDVGTSMTVTKPSNGVNISSISVTLVGGGGGGTSNGGGGAGGGGGGRLVTSSGLTSSGNLSITRGGGGAVNGYGGTTSFTYSAATLYADGGTPAVGVQGGASPLGGGSYNYGYVGSSLVGGGGGGAGGAATDVNGGPASGGVGPGGPGYYNVPYSGAGWGAWGSGGSQSSAGAGGRGGYDNPSATGGNNGYWSITYVGPARN
jgi:hypothetical protein